MTEELNETVKVLSQTVEKLAKSLEARHDTCCKYITISVITIALFTTIAICCIFGQRNNQYLEVKCVTTQEEEK
jgi:uncharacterized Rmd1/YagE family protein